VEERREEKRRKRCGEDLFAKRSLPAPLPKNCYTPLASPLPGAGSGDASGI